MINFRAPPALIVDLLKFFVAGTADLHSRAVIEQDVQFFNVIDSLPCNQRMGAAGNDAIIPPRVHRLWLAGSGAKVSRCFPPGRADCPEPVRAERGPIADGIEINDPVHILVKSITTATLQHCPARLVPAPRQNGRAKFAAGSDDGHNVVLVSRDHQPDGHLAVVRRVGRVERPAAPIKTNFTAHGLVQFTLKERAPLGMRQQVCRASSAEVCS